MKPTLLVLAAGMGTRYGGNKQLDEVGPSGETIIDYSIYDAIRAGFGKIVFVIRRDIEEQVKERFVKRLKGKIEVDYVFQEITNLPEGVNVSGGHIDAAAYQSVCEQLMVRFPRAKKVIVTLRGSINANHNTWSGVLWDGQQLRKAPDYDITHIVDRVGGGDSFMGGLIYGLITYAGDDQKALNFAVAASCLKHTIHGDYNLVTVAEVENLMKDWPENETVRDVSWEATEKMVAEAVAAGIAELEAMAREKEKKKR